MLRPWHLSKSIDYEMMVWLPKLWANKTYRLGIKAGELKHGLLENLAFTVIQSLSHEYLHLLAMFPLFVK